MPVGVNLKTFVCSSTGEGTIKHDYREPVLYVILCAGPCSQQSTWCHWHSLLPNVAESWALTACSEAVTTLVYQPPGLHWLMLLLMPTEG